MQTILTVLHLFLALGLIGLVLIQHGKGADMGAAFGSGASATVFGARGSGNFLSRSTAVLATLFFVTSMALAYFAAQVGEPVGLMDGADRVPAVPPAVQVRPEALEEVPPPEITTDDGSEVPPPAAVPTPSAEAPEVPAPAVALPPAVEEVPAEGQPPAAGQAEGNR